MGDVLKLKYFALSIFIIFLVVLQNVESISTELQKEIVSIYNDNFTTPESRYPYFIEVYRCVKLDVSKFISGPCGTDGYPVQANMTEIEIVVPDLTNDGRGPNKTKRFYKYIVFNHTSCTCGQKLKDRKLYNTSSNNQVPEKYFKENYERNPKNLRSQPDFCNKTHVRYHLSSYYARPDQRYLAYKQCLPGCVVHNKTDFRTPVKGADGGLEYLTLVNDTHCEAFDKKMTDLKPCLEKSKVAGMFVGDNGNSPDMQEKNAEVLIYVESGKIFLAAGLLSLILLTILIMDFTLCRRKKGFVYALFSCGKENACEHCTQRFLNQTTI